MGYKITDLELFSKGFALPKRFSHVVSTKDLPYRVEIEAVLEGDRFVCEALRAERKRGGPPVTSKGIRNLPVNALIRSISMEYVHRVKKNPKGGGVVISPARVSGLKRLADAGPTEETLEHVALVYQLAYACADSPTKAVEDAFRLPRSTAERWVSRARDQGLIDIPDPRRRK